MSAYMDDGDSDFQDLCALYADPTPAYEEEPAPAPELRCLSEQLSASPDPAASPAPSEAATRSGARHWCFTLNHPTDDEYNYLCCLPDTNETGHCNYIVVGREVGEAGTPHLQGYLELDCQQLLGWLKSHISQRAHWEKRRGGRDAAREYCMKDGEWYEAGRWREEERGRRRDVEAMVEQASQGTSFYDAAQEECTTALFPQAYSKLLEGHALANTPQWRVVTTIVKIGPTGCGKTRSAYDNWPHCFLQDCSTGSEIWWDGYTGQQRLILDDFEGCIPFRYLLRLLDGYPIRLKVKGAFTYGTWSEVIITTNVPIISWYRRRNDIAPLMRRIDHIERYTGEPGVYHVEYPDRVAL